MKEKELPQLFDLDDEEIKVYNRLFDAFEKIIGEGSVTSSTLLLVAQRMATCAIAESIKDKECQIRKTDGIYTIRKFCEQIEDYINNLEL